MARPRKANQAEKRTAFLGFQVTPSERAEILRRAAETQRSPSDFCRIVLLSDRKAPAPLARDRREITELCVAISRVGNNQNQMTKLAHQLHALPQEAEYRRLADLIVAALEKVLAL
jgi:hypothetical protein